MSILNSTLCNQAHQVQLALEKCRHDLQVTIYHPSYTYCTYKWCPGTAVWQHQAFVPLPHLFECQRYCNREEQRKIVRTRLSDPWGRSKSGEASNHGQYPTYKLSFEAETNGFVNWWHLCKWSCDGGWGDSIRTPRDNRRASFTS